MECMALQYSTEEFGRVSRIWNGGDKLFKVAKTVLRGTAEIFNSSDIETATFFDWLQCKSYTDLTLT